MKHISPGLLLFLVHRCYAALVIPAPNGTYGVDMTEMVLTDPSRSDPVRPETENRSVIVSAFYPVALRTECDWDLVPYMPNKTAAYYDEELAFVGVPKGTMELIKLHVCSSKRSKTRRHPHADPRQQEFPLVLFSPGGGESRLIYSAMAQTVASYGYTVVTIDHPYDAAIVEFPDGSVVLSKNPNPGNSYVQHLHLQTRAEDVSFIVDELGKAEILRQLLPHSSSDCLTNTKVAMYGHSAGGATAVNVMANDSRIVGGFNMDGSFKSVGRSLFKHGAKNPVVLFQEDTYLHPENVQVDWLRMWPHLNWKRWLLLKNSAHGTFTDAPLLAQLAGIDPLPKEVAFAIGSTPGDRVMDIITAYIVEFMDFVLKGKPHPLLQEPSEAFPEVEFPNGTYTN